MIKVTCSTKGCQSPIFVIPVPNTRTSLVYAKELQTQSNSNVQTTDQGINIGTSGLLENNLGMSEEAQLTEIREGQDKIIETRITTTEKLDNNDYLVVYCNSGHKNIVLF